MLAVLLLVAIAGGLVLHRADGSGTPKFCTASLPIRLIEGRTVAVQDKDPDGTRCDGDRTTPGMDTLGTDCRLRASDGTVLATLTSSREDGTCGGDSPTSE